MNIPSRDANEPSPPQIPYEDCIRLLLEVGSRATNPDSPSELSLLSTTLLRASAFSPTIFLRKLRSPNPIDALHYLDPFSAQSLVSSLNPPTTAYVILWLYLSVSRNEIPALLLQQFIHSSKRRLALWTSLLEKYSTLLRPSHPSDSDILAQLATTLETVISDSILPILDTSPLPLPSSILPSLRRTLFLTYKKMKKRKKKVKQEIIIKKEEEEESDSGEDDVEQITPSQCIICPRGSSSSSFGRIGNSRRRRLPSVNTRQQQQPAPPPLRSSQPWFPIEEIESPPPPPPPLPATAVVIPPPSSSSGTVPPPSSNSSLQRFLEATANRSNRKRKRTEMKNPENENENQEEEEEEEESLPPPKRRKIDSSTTKVTEVTKELTAPPYPIERSVVMLDLVEGPVEEGGEEESISVRKRSVLEERRRRMKEKLREEKEKRAQERKKLAQALVLRKKKLEKRRQELEIRRRELRRNGITDDKIDLILGTADPVARQKYFQFLNRRIEALKGQNKWFGPVGILEYSSSRPVVDIHVDDVIGGFLVPIDTGEEQIDPSGERGMDSFSVGKDPPMVQYLCCLSKCTGNVVTGCPKRFSITRSYVAKRSYVENHLDFICRGCATRRGLEMTSSATTQPPQPQTPPPPPPPPPAPSLPPPVTAPLAVLSPVRLVPLITPSQSVPTPTFAQLGAFGPQQQVQHLNPLRPVSFPSSLTPPSPSSVLRVPAPVPPAQMRTVRMNPYSVSVIAQAVPQRPLPPHHSSVIHNPAVVQISGQPVPGSMPLPRPLPPSQPMPIPFHPPPQPRPAMALPPLPPPPPPPPRHPPPPMIAQPLPPESRQPTFSSVGHQNPWTGPTPVRRPPSQTSVRFGGFRRQDNSRDRRGRRDKGRGRGRRRRFYRMPHDEEEEEEEEEEDEDYYSLPESVRALPEWMVPEDRLTNPLSAGPEIDIGARLNDLDEWFEVVKSREIDLQSHRYEMTTPILKELRGWIRGLELVLDLLKNRPHAVARQFLGRILDLIHDVEGLKRVLLSLDPDRWD